MLVGLIQLCLFLLLLSHAMWIFFFVKAHIRTQTTHPTVHRGFPKSTTACAYRFTELKSFLLLRRVEAVLLVVPVRSRRHLPLPPAFCVSYSDCSVCSLGEHTSRKERNRPAPPLCTVKVQYYSSFPGMCLLPCCKTCRISYFIP